MKVLILIVLASLAGFCQSPASKSTVKQDEGSSSRANRALAQQLEHQTTDQRIRTYEGFLRSAPDSVPNQIGLVSAYLQKVRESGDFGYLDRASRIVDQMLDRDSGNFAALRYQNEIDLQRHEFRKVVERAEMMVKDAPSDPGTWANLGDASMELGEYDKAHRAYVKMFALRPGLGSYNRLAYWRFVTGDGPAAIELMKNAVEAGDAVPENSAWCMAELGDMYFKLGRISEAQNAYASALDLFPKLHRALAGLGKADAALGKKQSAIRNYEHAQAIVPLVEYAGALEDLYRASGLTAQASGQRDLVSTIEKLGRVTNERTNRNLALLLADHDRDLTFALELMKAEIPVRGDVYSWDALSWVLFKSGQLDEAKAASEKALKLETPEPLFYYHASKIASASGDQNAGQKYAERLFALNSRFDFTKAEFVTARAR